VSPWRLSGVLAAFLTSLGCGKDTPTSPTTTATAGPSSTTYASTLGLRGTRFYSFTVLADGPVAVTLASVTSAVTGIPAGEPLEISLGIPAGTDCSPTYTDLLSASLVTQMTQSVTAGIYCIRVSDEGLLTAPVRFAVRFTHT
jgi:hypothetical protein